MRVEGNSFMNAEYCFFDGNFKKVKSFVTLTASFYHSLLSKLVALANMQCKQKNKENIEIFSRLFDKGYKKMRGENKNFFPGG